jgi:hypothetical protein
MHKRSQGDLHLTFADQERAIHCDEELLFGRDSTCDIVIDPDDTGVSRKAGLFEHDGRNWWLTNLSTKRALHVLEAGFGHPVFPSGKDVPHRWPLLHNEATVLVPGSYFTYQLQLQTTILSEAYQGRTRPLAQDRRTTDISIDLTPAQRRALVALCSRFLTPAPEYDPRLLTYQEAAHILFLDKKTVEKHIAAVRQHVRQLVVLPDDPEQLREGIGRYFLANRLLTPEDLTSLRAHLNADAGSHHDADNPEAGPV